MYQSIMLNAFNMTEITLDESVRILKKFKPKVIIAYASAIYLIARSQKKDDLKITKG